MSLPRRFLRFTAIFIALIAGVVIPAWAQRIAPTHSASTGFSVNIQMDVQGGTTTRPPLE